MNATARSIPVKTIIMRAALCAIGIVIAGVGPWIVLAPLNARFHPEIPWAAFAAASGLVLLLAWLNGTGWPQTLANVRRCNLRRWRPEPGTWQGENLGVIVGLACMLAGMAVVWILTSQEKPLTDLSAYPTSALRLSIVIMGPLTSGVVEEAAFRGYMQSQLERW